MGGWGGGVGSCVFVCESARAYMRLTNCAIIFLKSALVC